MDVNNTYIVFDGNGWREAVFDPKNNIWVWGEAVDGIQNITYYNSAANPIWYSFRNNPIMVEQNKDWGDGE